MTSRTWRPAVLVAVLVAAVVGVGGVVAGLWSILAGDETPFEGLSDNVTWEDAIPAPTLPSREAQPEPQLDLRRYATDDPASPWVVVNKQHPIAEGWEPSELVEVGQARVRPEVVPDLTAMLDAATRAGARLEVRSGYRSYAEQAAARAQIERRRGFAHAERYSARPGFSEHQTGLAVDFDSGSDPGCNLQTCFARTTEGLWLAEHAWEFGFVVRYTEQNAAVTGYAPEGWHLRWVGRELTTYMHEQQIGSIEEALGVTGGSEYAAG